MRLDPFIRDYQKFMDDLVEVLQSEQTRFYLDTSLLMWLIRLGSTARTEFLEWCRSRPENSIRVPVWAAHELHRHLIRNTVLTNVRTTVTETRRKLDEFVRLASERADEETCRLGGFPSRDIYLSEIAQAFAKVNGLAKVVENDHQISSATDEVISFVNDHLLNTDIEPIIERLGRVGDFRYSHLMPPGYHDKKDENRFGDVIIWEEILEDITHIVSQERRHGVLISRDEKTDWVSSAPLIKVGEKHPQKSNRDLDFDATLAHPLLVHEFLGRAKGDSLYVVPPSFLASALDYYARKAGHASPVQSWISAVHRPDQLGKLAGAELHVASSSVSPANMPPGQLDVRPAIETQVAYKATAITELMGLSVSGEVTAFLNASPLDQPRFAQSWRVQLASGEMSSERFGRLLSELCLRGRTEWLVQIPAIVEELRTQVPLNVLNGFVLGVAAPAYFDPYGEVRGQPSLSLGAMVLVLERDPQLEPAFTALGRFLEEANVALPYVPGTGRQKVRMKLDANDGGSPRTLRDIRLGNETVMADELPVRSPRRLSILLERDRQGGCKGQEIRALISQEFLVPIDLLSSDQDKNVFTWPPDAGLVSLDPFSPGGISATVMVEENEND